MECVFQSLKVHFGPSGIPFHEAIRRYRRLLKCTCATFRSFLLTFYVWQEEGGAAMKTERSAIGRPSYPWRSRIFSSLAPPSKGFGLAVANGVRVRIRHPAGSLAHQSPWRPVVHHRRWQWQPHLYRAGRRHVCRAGRSARQHLRAHRAESNLAMIKAFPFTEHTGFEFRAEAYNFINHPNLASFGQSGSLNMTPTSAQFGQITGKTTTNTRTLQVGARVHF